MGTIAGEITRLQGAKTALKSAIENKGVQVGSGTIDTYAAKVSQIGEIQGSGQHLVTFYDYDGTVLKRQRVNTGESATAPTPPTHEYLTFAEWNNPYTNVQLDVDTGAIYNTTDGKTYLFITLNMVTGLAPILYFSKSTTSEMIIEWGDGTISTSIVSGNQMVQHTFAVPGSYIIKIDNSKGGYWTAGQGNDSTSLFGATNYRHSVIKIFFGSNVSTQTQSFRYCYSLKCVSLGNVTNLAYAIFSYCYSLQHINLTKTQTFGFSDIFSFDYSLKKVTIPSNITSIVNYMFNTCNGIRKLILPSSINNISGSSFANCCSIMEYIFLSAIPPTLVNINAFAGINSLCKIYVPDASVDAYKVATNWVTYASYIYPLSQKPQADE